MGLRWCYRDEIQKRIRENRYEACIINLASRGDEGTHWTVFRVVPGHGSKDVIYYADPFGLTLSGYAPEELRVGLPIIENRIAFQRPKTSLCGYYAVLFAKAMNEMNQVSQKDFEDILFKAIGPSSK